MVHLPTALFSLSYIRDSSNRRSHYAPCGARRDFLATDELADLISIHAPLAGRDHYRRDNRYLRRDFNPRAPCGARHNWYGKIGVAEQDFNPRAPCGARPVGSLGGMGYAYFNPRAPCGARPVTFSIVLPPIVISIHAPLAGRDRFRCAIAANLTKFQSTRPLRGATLPAYINLIAEHTFQSTRPLRGATGTRLPPRYSGRYFNPRAPCGARPRLICAALCPHQHFNPRAPCGARRDARRRDHHGTVISIHAPLAGRDGM